MTRKNEPSSRSNDAGKSRNGKGAGAKPTGDFRKKRTEENDKAVNDKDRSFNREFKPRNEAGEGFRKRREESEGNGNRDRSKKDRSFKREFKPRNEAGEGFRKRREEGEGNGNRDRSEKDRSFKREFKPRTEVGKKNRKIKPETGSEEHDSEPRSYSKSDKKPYREFSKNRSERDFDKDKFKPRREKTVSEDDQKKSFRSEEKYGEKQKPSDRKRSPRTDHPQTNGAENFKPKRKFKSEQKENSKPYSKKGELKDRKPRFKSSEQTEPDQVTFSKGLEEIERQKKWYPDSETKEINGAMTLNKYISHSGECSRRDAAEMVKQGKVRVNGELILEPGHRVLPGDTVTLQGKKMTPQKNMVYILLNKPKGFITTTEDPEDRKTVMDLVANADVDRLFPVGRLDRNTTGVLLLTNDGTLANKLTHPSYNVKKVYHVTLDKNLTRADYEQIVKGVELEDGRAEVDQVAYLETRKEIGLEIHSGKNRIVRRIFESLGYVVEKLDRVMYAGLTKKNVSRGKWRFLNEKEVIFLKHFKG
ncbi:MAG: pseudouridine synthase [Bacteroidetes bacterium]|nr:pseudouridine synthase [Bacteroidota bacterium]